MASREDSLVDIPRERWLELRTRFSQDFPAGFTAHACILMQDTTLKEHPDFPLIVCAPFGNPDYGVVCIWPHTEAIVEISLYSSSEENPKIYEALMQTKRIDWRKRVLFACVMPNVVPCACSVLSALGIKFGRDDTYVAYISKEEAKQFEVDIPPDVVLSSPRLEDVELMNSVWPHRYPGSERYYSFMVEWGRGLAVYGSAPSNDLRAWVFSGLRGEIHAIHVMDDHRRKGYAQLLLKVLGKQLAENDCEVFGCIVLKNAPSKAMFLKLGFNFVATTTWIFSL